MRRIAYISAIFAGYASMSMGILKISWLKYGVHFRPSEYAHEPQALTQLDIMLIATLIAAGICLVTLQLILPALLIALGLSLFEMLYLHSGPHGVGQLTVIVGLVMGQVITLVLNVIALRDQRRIYSRSRYS